MESEPCDFVFFNASNVLEIRFIFLRQIGIRDGATAKAVADLADAVVIGSRIIEEIEKSSDTELLDNVGSLLNTLRNAIDDN